MTKKKKKTNQVPTKAYNAFLQMTALVHCAEYATTMKKLLTVAIIWQCPELTKTDYLGSTIRQLHTYIHWKAC